MTHTIVHQAEIDYGSVALEIELTKSESMLGKINYATAKVNFDTEQVFFYRRPVSNITEPDMDKIIETLMNGLILKMETKINTLKERIDKQNQSKEEFEVAISKHVNNKMERIEQITTELTRMQKELEVAKE